MKQKIKKLVVAALLFAAGNVTAQTVIIQDSFTSSGSLNIRTHVPDINLTGNSWISHVNAANDPALWLTGNGNVNSTLNGFAIIGINNYNLSPQLSVSLDVTANTLAAAAGEGSGIGTSYLRGIGVGWYAVDRGLGTGSGINFPTGLSGLWLTPDGNVELVINGVADLVNVYAVPNFNKNTSYNLSLTVDTVTGAVVYAAVDSTDITAMLGSTDAFVVGNLNYVGFAASTGVNGSYFGLADNFLLSAVPEPSAWLLVVCGVILTGLFRRLKNKLD